MPTCSLVSTYSRKLSSLVDSLSLLNSEIKSLVQQRQYIEALKLYTKSPVYTTRFTYPSLLKACASLSNLQYGKTIHSSIITTGLHSDQYITSSLINIYVKCGTFTDAVKVFDQLPKSGVSVDDVTIWNSIIDGYFRFGQLEEGMVQFGRMQSSGIRPDAYSLCILLGYRDGHVGYKEGKQIHSYIVRNMLNFDPFLETALIDTYFKCGRPTEARYLFKKLKDRSNIVAWNVMIGGFGENGLWENSLEYYLLAKTENVKVVSSSFTCTLSACGQGEFVSFGKQVHCDAIKVGFEDDPYVHTSLLTMYGKCQMIESAEKVFNEVPDKEIELWNALISAYVGNGYAYDALRIYKQMKLCTVLSDSFTILNVLTSSSMAGLYDLGRLIHTEIVKRPLQSSITIQSALLTMYSKFGDSNYANSIFSTMKERDVVAWGSVISGFCQNRKYKEALDFFRAMEADLVKPDSDIMASIISACTGLEKVDLGCTIHGFVIKSGLQLDVFVASSLLDMYSKFGFPERAGNIFSDMPLKNLVAWNSIISCYCRNNLPDLSINLFSQVLRNDLYPDSVSFTSVLAAISSVAALLKGKSVHGYLVRLWIPFDLQVENTLIDMYIKCGLLKYAQHIFERISEKNLVAWNSMIGGYGSHGECSKAIELFDEMRSSGIKPDDVTFLSLLSSCNHSGLIEEGLHLFEMMKMKFGIEPRMEHYVNIVDLYGRAGCLGDAYSFVKNMPVEPDRSIWLSLLCSCKIHLNLELGEMVANKLLNMEPSKGSNYVQLLNLYGEAELWDRTANLRASMKEKGLKKTPGCSWIEVRNKVDVFYSGDCSSPITTEIYDTLSSLKRNMIKKGAKHGIIE
ncbi:pentatricopeptide repeat-containing protein At2g40720 [Ricinus communis]|uniref:pentatricopeptide repeat-containing protein At2g40720 n=1 Tax=Ricinus communis TaxID=3988 RepID=UPI00201A4C54|nr:pentatricopeptide repeat-containing protein At2g40720 [Ricinus communis]